MGSWAQQADGRWTAPLKLPPDEGVGDLFVNGKRQTRARYPNAPADGDPRKGWLFAAKCEPAIDVWKGNTRFCFHAGDLPAVGDTSGLVVDIVGGINREASGAMTRSQLYPSMAQAGLSIRKAQAISLPQKAAAIS